MSHPEFKYPPITEPPTRRTIPELIADAQLELFGWVPWEAWETMHPTEKREAIRYRLRVGTWKLGVHVSRPSTKELWVNLKNCKAWIEGREPDDNSACPR